MFAYDFSCKIVLVGECSVGKTALTQRLIYDTYQEKMNATIGVDYTTKIFKMNDEDMDRGWEQLEKTLGDYKAVRDGERPTIYNTPSIVEVMVGYEFE